MKDVTVYSVLSDDAQVIRMALHPEIPTCPSRHGRPRVSHRVVFRHVRGSFWMYSCMGVRGEDFAGALVGFYKPAPAGTEEAALEWLLEEVL